MEKYERMQGFKILAVYEDHTGGGAARIFYAVHPDGRGLVQISSRKVAEHGSATDPRWHPSIFSNAQLARECFMNRIQQYTPTHPSVI